MATNCTRRAAVAALLLLCACRGEERPTRARSEKPPVDAECARKMDAQRQVLASDVLAEQETFAKHPAEARLSGPPADVDPESSRYARAFRTRLGEELARSGVNFAGAYSLVSVGMTGWGPNWYIVDRRSGKVTLFPYYAHFLEARKESNLLIMNPRPEIRRALDGQDVDCRFLDQQELTSLRSFYFLWKDDQLVRIGPADIDPPRNRFWDEYLPPPVTTDRKSYTLEEGPYGPQVTIRMTLRAPGHRTIYIVNCNGQIGFGLQRLERDRWVNAWVAEMNACFSTPIAIPPGGQYARAMTPISRPDVGRAFGPGRYRAVWHGVYTAIDPRDHANDEELPLEERVSAPFTLSGGQAILPVQ